MSIKIKPFVFFVLSLLYGVMFSQDINYKELETRPFETIARFYKIHEGDSIKAKNIAQTYILKAKKENDSTKIARGYTFLAFVSKTYKAIKYLDTSLVYSKNSIHKDFPTIGYLYKSRYQFNKEEYEKSLKNGILAYQFAIKKNNVELQLTALHQINAINELWGDYKKVLETEFVAYNLLFENPEIEHFSENYLFSLEGLGKSYARLKKPDSALIYFKKGITEALKIKDTITYSAFVSRTGMALFEKEDYFSALDSLNKGDQFREAYNNSYLPYYYFYVGSCQYNLGKKDVGIAYFKKIDSIYEKRHVLSPELPLVYDKLISYYRNKYDDQKQLEYLYKLVRVERIINVKRKNIKDKTEKEYHIPKLLEDKEVLIADLNERNKETKLMIWGTGLLLLIMIVASLYYFKRQRVFKKRFENLIALQDKNSSLLESENLSTNGISLKIIEEILNHLNTFESKNNFLSKGVSLIELAKQFGTNSTYLSKVINLKKDKNFSNYINDLRIDFIIQELKLNKKYRKYTIKAIASECGFKNSESFSKAFYKKFGIYPSYYLRNLDG